MMVKASNSTFGRISAVRNHCSPATLARLVQMHLAVDHMAE